MPPVAEVTSTERVQEAPAMVPLTRLIPPPPGAAVTVPPQPVLTTLGLAAFTRPEGYRSVKATPVRETKAEFGLGMVNVRVEMPLAGMVPGEKDLVMSGGVRVRQPVKVTLSINKGRVAGVVGPELKPTSRIKAVAVLSNTPPRTGA